MPTSFAPVDVTLRAEVEDLIMRYATAIDRRDWDLFRSVFADNAHIDYGPLMGTWDNADAFTAFMRQAHASAGRSIHRMTNIVISAQETVSARSYGDSLILNAADETNGDHGAAAYDDIFTRGADGLRISSRTTTIVLYEKFAGNLAAGF
jgi:hypothetical protein